MTITVSTTDRRDGKALALFARCAEWQRGKTKHGRSFFAIPGSQRGLYHMADTRECSCFDFQQSRNLCKHVRAVRLWMAAFKTGAVAPKPRSAATLEDERIALTPTGAAHLAPWAGGREQALSSTVWKSCAGRRGELHSPEHRDRFCDACSERSRRLLASMDTQDIG